jgi:trans-aconitate 3-methyltransferase
MVAQAVSYTKEQNVSFRQGSAEDLTAFDDGSIDMVVSSQAAHWFDYSKVWPMLARKLRKGGTVAFLGYKENVVVGRPKATAVLDHYCYGPNVELMGPYWEQPGRNILRDMYRMIVPPENDFEKVMRWEYEPTQEGEGKGMAGRSRIMYKSMKLGEMEGYVRSFSCYYRWLEAHPEHKPRQEGGMVVDEMFEEILKVEPEWQKYGDDWRDIEVESEWGSVVLLARKR